MQKRLVFMAIGDYSDDGHGKTATIALNIAGEDVSNERLKQAKEEAITLTGVNIDELCADSDDGCIDYDTYTQLDEHGFIPENKKLAISEPVIIIDEDTYEKLVESGEIEDGDEDTIAAADLLMKFLGYNIPDFSYEILNANHEDYIVGEDWGKASTPVPSFGYGLFQ